MELGGGGGRQAFGLARVCLGRFIAEGIYCSIEYTGTSINLKLTLYYRKLVKGTVSRHFSIFTPFFVYEAFYVAVVVNRSNCFCKSIAFAKMFAKDVCQRTSIVLDNFVSAQSWSLYQRHACLVLDSADRVI